MRLPRSNHLTNINKLVTNFEIKIDMFDTHDDVMGKLVFRATLSPPPLQITMFQLSVLDQRILIQRSRSF